MGAVSRLLQHPRVRDAHCLKRIVAVGKQSRDETYCRGKYSGAIGYGIGGIRKREVLEMAPGSLTGRSIIWSCSKHPYKSCPISFDSIPLSV